MVKTLNAIYDGRVLRPDEPIDLNPNTRVQIIIIVKENSESSSTRGVSFLRTAKSLNLEGPADWSTHFEDYLYEKESNE